MEQLGEVNAEWRRKTMQWEAAESAVWVDWPIGSCKWM